jgi:hypothetical protein
MTTTATKTITPALDDDATRSYPDWFKGTILVSMSYREADGTNDLLVYVLTPAQWAAHPTNIQAAGPPVAGGHPPCTNMAHARSHLYTVHINIDSQVPAYTRG